ncbi:zonular occludens toxin domain-containing protein [Chitinolyticbacter meiyuanensis]|uniref:zonular occludens toxin domain-containing protein n=1 Tax=Chitinolyticbacter meiyuanensis TaxID=682798 RepID=UPI001651D70D|nr:zonular occludens toxin domain-containing protein [Chitinolyticbacter meiyuanensis]
MSNAVATLFTGLQGNGKTLAVVTHIAELAAKLTADDPPIYTHGIKALSINRCASLLDPNKWYELEVGVTVVIDEAQKVFPTRPNGSARPAKVAAFEDMRHSGKQAILITQHPGLIDSDLRKLINRHVHLERIMGRQMSQWLEWPKVHTPENKADRKKAASHFWAFPTKNYALYKSAEVHNLKPAMPKALKYTIGIMLAGVLLAIAAGVFIMMQAKNPGIASAEASSPASAPAGQAAPQPAGQFTREEKLDYFAARVPRLAGLPHTAPAYDDITAPRIAPKPVACAVMGDTCKCFTQQATLIPQMDQATCKRIVAEGWFDESADQVAESPARIPKLPS